MTDPGEERCGWVQWDDGTWSELDGYGTPSERRTLEEMLESLRRAEGE